MKTITITKKDAEFIKRTATKEIKTEKDYEHIFYLPTFYALTEVMITWDIVTGKHRQTGNWIEYNVKFNEDAQQILEIY